VLSELIEKTLKKTGIPSISIALVRNNDIVWKAAFGYANLRTKTPATTETLYNAASTFKAVTATAVMQLHEAGKLKLDEPVNRYLGESPIKDRLQSDKSVTLTHLLSHWSGLTSWPERGEAAMKPIWGRELPRTLEQVAPELYSIRAPEVQFEYNNYGYALAGLLLEKLSGCDYEAYVCDYIFKPLGGTTPRPVWPSPDMVEVMALPYDMAGGKAKPVAQVHTDAYPAGNAYVRAEDMARFLGAHVNGGEFQGHRILSEASVTEMHNPRFGGNYGFGLRVKRTSNGTTMIRHTGRLPGMSSMMMGDVYAHVGVYYVANATDVPPEIAEAAIALLRGDPYPAPERRPVYVDPNQLDRYVGDYEMGSDVFTISREAGTLWLVKNRKKKTEFFAESATTFFIRGDAGTVTFEENSEGLIDRMVITREDWTMQTAKKHQ
jgi:CubicO group peptidase (beta-lactamase class C family)